ncbi:MAG: hypothetical protein II272_09535 [Oscillospiraceae bacterium]|jgi:uncharacterized membrane protein HdeD (DUF308 family)|nr:hypothetical protein [Oscillospiraceae bacterium]
MKNGSNAVVRSAKIINIISASLMAVAGVLLMTVDSMEEVLAQRILLGILFGLTGAARLFGFFSNDLYRLAFQYDFAFGILCELMTLLLVLAPEQNYGVMHMLLVMYALFDALLKVQMSMDARRFGMKCWGVILGTALAVGVAGAFAAAAIQTELIRGLVMVGFALCLSGVENCWITAYTVRIRAKKKNISERFGIEE